MIFWQVHQIIGKKKFLTDGSSKGARRLIYFYHELPSVLFDFLVVTLRYFYEEERYGPEDLGLQGRFGLIVKDLDLVDLSKISSEDGILSPGLHLIP
jgi:hypothetical protein